MVHILFFHWWYGQFVVISSIFLVASEPPKKVRHIFFQFIHFTKGRFEAECLLKSLFRCNWKRIVIWSDLKFITDLDKVKKKYVFVPLEMRLSILSKVK